MCCAYVCGSVRLVVHLQVRDGSRSRRSVRATVPQGSIRLPPTLTQALTSEQQSQASRVQFNFYQKGTVFQVGSLPASG